MADLLAATLEPPRSRLGRIAHGPLEMTRRTTHRLAHFLQIGSKGHENRQRERLTSSGGTRSKLDEAQPSARAGTRPEQSFRVLIIKGVIIPEQLVLHAALQNAGAEITLVGTDVNIYRGTWPWVPRSPDDLDTVLLRPITPALKRGHLWWAYRGLVSLMRRVRPNVIHVESEPWGVLVLQALIARRLVGLRAPITVHSGETIFRQGSGVEQLIRNLVLRFVMPRIQGFATWSNEGIEVARQEGLGNIPITVVPGVIPDPADFVPVSATDRRELRRQFRLPLDQPIVGFVGRLADQKGVRDLLDAMTRLGDSAPFLVIWGAGPLQDVVEAAFRERRVRGQYGGALGLQEVARALQACDVVAVPSRTTPTWKEQFGRIIVEAMLAGAPIIAYASGAIPEVLGSAGILVVEGDIDGLSNAIRRLVDDPATCRELGVKARQEALRRFHPDALAEEMIRFWSEVVSRMR